MLLVFGTMLSLRHRGDGLEESKHLAVHGFLGLLVIPGTCWTADRCWQVVSQVKHMLFGSFDFNYGELQK